MDQSEKDKIKRAGQSMLVLVCVVFGVLFISNEGSRIQSKAIAAANQAELAGLARAIVMYQIDTGEYPQNTSKQNFCHINKEYSNGRCLVELQEKQYYLPLPTSRSTDEPYLYFMTDRLIAVGTISETMPADHNYCGSVGKKHYWCLKL